MTKLKRIAALMLVLVVSSTVQASPSRPQGVGEGLEPLAGEKYSRGMHLLVTRSGGRDYVFASSSVLSPSGDGIRVYDVTNPARPKKVASVPCIGNQAFLTLSHDGNTLVVGESGTHTADDCMPDGVKGFYTIDVSDPRKPEPLGYAIDPRSGHHITAHPTKPLIYVSHGEVVSAKTPVFDVWSIKNPAKPTHVFTAPVTGYHGPHDIGFNNNGTMAVASSMSAIQVLDTSDPTKPKEVEVLQCPGCTHNHEAHFTPDQKHVVVSEEFGGGAPGPCGTSALYFYEWNPKAAPHMTLVGTWQPEEFGTPKGSPTTAGTCTSHVFDISSDGTKIATSWHIGGVRVVDITERKGFAVGSEGDGPNEIGWFISEGADSWSAKFDRTGRYVFVNDLNNGFEVYRLKSK